MKTVTNRPVAQGDMLIIPTKAIPVSAKAAKVTGNHFILAHSETGHHHVIERAKAEVYEAADDAFVAYIHALGDGAEITHQRSFDTHEPLMLSPGQNYEVRRQREHIPEGFRAAQD
jgi:hypothetical protein